MFRRKKKEIKPAKTGGICFFISLVCLMVLTLICLKGLPDLIDRHAWSNLKWYAAGILIGGWFADFFIKGHFAVLFHETKHSIVSNLVGNRARGMKIRRKTGHFRYEYSQATEKYNALIALAPYFLPMFTLPSFIALLLFHGENAQIAILMFIGAAHGADLVTNLRDVHSGQTDLTQITGGYFIGLLFVTCINIVLSSLLIAWVAQGLYGLKYLLHGVYVFVLHLIVWYQSRL